jgi:dephospho-CoA kinase
MLRVGLTGDLGSGKSTVATMLAKRGAVVLSSDAMARAMMLPGETLYAKIVDIFGRSVVAADGTLDRGRLAKLAFDPVSPRVEQLNAIVHPAVLSAQAEAVAKFTHSNKIIVVESALIFSAYGQTAEALASRFDCILLVVAPADQKILRFVQRASGGKPLSAEEGTALETDARSRLALQRNEVHADECLVIRNDKGVAELDAQVSSIWEELVLREHGVTPRGL